MGSVIFGCIRSHPTVKTVGFLALLNYVKHGIVQSFYIRLIVILVFNVVFVVYTISMIFIEKLPAVPGVF